MTLSGKAAVRKAFENTSGMEWDTLRDEFVSVRLEQLYNPFGVEDFSTRQLRFNIVQNGRIPQIGIFIAM